MFELKVGMKVKTNFKEEILYFNTVDNDEKFWCSSKKNKTSNHFLENKDIDWEETAKLNGIPYDPRPTLKEFTKGMNTLFKNRYEDLPSLEEVEKELGRKETQGKIRPNLLPITELKEVIRVFEFGVEKYSINNWKHVKDPINEYSNALSRHLLDYLEGEKKASDSNLPHLAHICANALILMWFENNKEE